MSINRAQVIKVKTLESQWIKARRAAGRAHDDAALAALKLLKIGRVCSSKDYSQHDMDEMVGAFLAEIQPANFGAQMNQQNQPEIRAALALARLDVLMLHLKLNVGGERSYVASIARNTFGDSAFEKFTDGQLTRLEGQIVRRLLQLHSKERVDQIQCDAAEHAAAKGVSTSPKKLPGDPF